MGNNTLDIRSIENYPGLFTAVECYMCGSTAARWVHAVGNDTECHECVTASEATYSAQGGQ
jgi:hypothetical protein